MKKFDQQRLISAITERINYLEDSLTMYQSTSVKKQQLSDDPDGSLDTTINASVDVKLIADKHQQVSQLTRSLLWLNSDQAGRCMDCGCDIPIPRLEAVLTTQLCINCAQKNSNS